MTIPENEIDEVPPEYLVHVDTLFSCEYLPDPMIDHYDPPTVIGPMGWAEARGWLLAQGYRVWIWPTEMQEGCVSSQSGELLTNMNEESGANDPKCLLIEEGINDHGESLAWVYHSDVPMEQWHELQRYSTYHLEPNAGEDGDDVEHELPSSYWPHIALCIR